MIKNKELRNNAASFYLLFFLTIIIFLLGMVRDIDLNGVNSDDKLTLYVYATSQGVDKSAQKKIILNFKEIAQKKCSSNKCKNRLEMQITQNDNYPLISLLINFIDKIQQNNNGNLVKISKSVHYGLLMSQILFFSVFLIFAFYTTETIRIFLVIFLSFIVITDQKLLNINLLGLFPYWNLITVSYTEYVPRAIALFSGTLSFIFFYLKKFKECILFIIISILYHLTLGYVIIILISSFFLFYLTIQNIKISQNKITKFFFLILSIASLLLNKLGLFVIILPCYFFCKNTKNFWNNNFIIFFLLCILSLLFIFTSTNLINKILVSNQHYAYLFGLINFINFDYLTSLFEYENIKNFKESYFWYYLEHAPTRIYPLLLSSLIIILIIENLDFFTRKLSYLKKKYFFDIKSFKVIFIIFIFCLSPIILDRLIYIGYVVKKIPNDLVTGMKREGTYYLMEKNNLIYEDQYLSLVDLTNREIYSFYILSQLYKNNN